MTLGLMSVGIAYTLIAHAIRLLRSTLNRLLLIITVINSCHSNYYYRILPTGEPRLKASHVFPKKKNLFSYQFTVFIFIYNS
jgi:hypothetical protein